MRYPKLTCMVYLLIGLLLRPLLVDWHQKISARRVYFEHKNYLELESVDSNSRFGDMDIEVPHQADEWFDTLSAGTNNPKWGRTCLIALNGPNYSYCINLPQGYRLVPAWKVDDSRTNPVLSKDIEDRR